MAGMALETCYRHPGEETRVHCTRCERPICPACMTQAPVGHHCPTCVAEGRRGSRRLRVRVRRPRSATVVLLALIVGTFVLETALGGSTDPEVLVRLGAMYRPGIADGELWRLVTAMFVHIGALHLLLNAYGLFLFGGLIESALGTRRFLAVYFVTGFVASAASFAFGGAQIAAGASGAIFGLLGAWLTYNWRRRDLHMAQSNIQGALILIGLNLFLGFSSRGIDNVAHIGGLVAGVLAGIAVEGFGTRGVRTFTRVAGLALLAVAGLALALWRVSTL